jgi:heme oxygenase
MDINVLRRATQSEHRAAEEAMPICADDLTLPIYICTLERLHGVVVTWEEACELSAPEWLQPLMRVRRRGTLLKQDLQLLSPDVRSARPPQLPLLVTDADYLGSMYVMEGSRLGGALIARHVEKVLHLPSGQGNAYFKGAGAGTGQLWMEFLEVLHSRVPDDQTEAVIAAAKGMFCFFTEWMLASSSITTNDRKGI